VNFKWGSWKLTFGAQKSCFLRIFLYPLIQLILRVIVVHFECYVRPFVEKDLGFCTKVLVFSTTLGPILQTGLAMLWHNLWEVMEYTSYSPDVGPSVWTPLEPSGLQAIYSRHWCEVSCHLLVQDTWILFLPHLDVLVPRWGAYISGVDRLLPMCQVHVAVWMEFSTISVCAALLFWVSLYYDRLNVRGQRDLELCRTDTSTKRLC